MSLSGFRGSLSGRVRMNGKSRWMGRSQLRHGSLVSRWQLGGDWVVNLEMKMSEVVDADSGQKRTRIGLYRALEKNSAALLAAAKLGDWQEAARLEVESMGVVAQLMGMPELPLTDDEQAEAIELMDRVLMLDDMTRMVSAGEEGALQDSADLVAGQVAIH
jgi:hypothetical protein